MKRSKTLLILILILPVISCKKYLDKKSDETLTTISTSDDLQSLLDLYLLVNYNDPGSAEESADAYYLFDTRFNNLPAQDQNLYTWANTNIFQSGSNDWSAIYDNVYRANTVLDNIDKVSFDSASSVVTYNDVKGQALFLRSKCFLQAAYIWSLAFDSLTCTTDKGIPLRLTSDFNVKTTRSNNFETYHQIITDLKLSIEFLPTKPIHVLRASKPAAMALLARTLLSMGDYTQCLAYCDSILSIKSVLVDFNSLDQDASIPFGPFNEEIIHESGIPYPSPLLPTVGKIDSTLVALYDPRDLRKQILLRDNLDGTYGFKGSYSRSLGYLFDGIATDEVYLMRAECSARIGDYKKCMDDINHLLINRYKKGSFIPLSASSSQEALAIVLNERRKELVFRNLRWMDIKRLNKQGANIELTRIIQGQKYRLSPNANRFALPIPEDIIKLAGISQNLQ